MVKKIEKKKKLNAKFTVQDDDVRLHAFIATFFSIVGFIIALISWKDEKYTMFYARQSVIIFIIAIFIQIIHLALSWIYIIGPIISFLLWVFIVLIWVLSWVYALSEEQREVPIIGFLGNRLKL